MKKNLRLFGIASLILVIVSLVVGCAAQPTAAPAQGPVKVQYWSNGWFAESINARKAVVDKFNQEYKGKIEVEYIQGNWDQGEQYIQNGVAAGSGIACVMEWYDLGAQDWYRKGYVNDLRPYMTPERQALMTEDQWKARSFEDGAIVMNGTVLGDPILTLMYNPEYLKAAGVEPATVDNPWSWDQLFENAKLLTVDTNGKHLGEEGFDKNNVAHWGYVERLDAEKVWENGFNFAQIAQGASIIRQENGKWGWFLDDKGSAAYERYLTPIQAGITPEAAIGLGGDSIEQMFAEGKAAIILRETFAIPTLHMNFPDFKFSVMPIPLNQGDKVFYKAGGEGMVMTKTCDQPEAAAEFMFWLMKPENLAGYAYGNGMAPANVKALEVDPFKSDSNWDIIRNYLAAGVTYSIPFNANLAEFRDTVVAPTLMDVAAGKKTFAEANQLIMEQADLLLNR